METMVSSSNNIEQVIYLWQKLIWSNQPEGLLSTALFIEMSIAILFIMTLLKEEEKEEKEKYYYNNLLNGFLTILLTIISGFISGKGFEILFRILHICSGAYGNVGFSLADIFISLLFGCIFVISGYCLLFNKKLYKLLRLLSVDADKGPATVIELEEKVVGKEAETVDRVEESEKADVEEMEAETVVIQQLNGNAGSQTGEKVGNGSATVIELEEKVVGKEAETVDRVEESEKADVEEMEAETVVIQQLNGNAGSQTGEKVGNGSATVIELEEKVVGKEAETVDRVEESEKADVEEMEAETVVIQQLNGNAGSQTGEKVGNGSATVIELEEKVVGKEAETVDRVEESEKADVEEMEAETVVIQQLNGNAGNGVKEKEIEDQKILAQTISILTEFNSAERTEIRQKAAKEVELGKIVARIEEYNAILTKFKEAKLEAIMTNNEAPIGYRLKAMTDYLKLKMEGKPEETGPKLQEIWSEFDKKVTKIKKIWIKIKEKGDYLNKIEAKPEAKVKDKLKTINESIEELTSNISKKLLSSNLNEARLKAIEARPKAIETRPKAIEDELKEIVAGFEEYNAILTKFKEAKLEAIMTNNEAPFVLRLKAMTDYLKLKMEGKPKETVTKLKKIWSEFYETVTKLQKIGSEIEETWNYLNKIEAKPGPGVYDELKTINESIVELMYNISKKLLSSELNEARPKAIEDELKEIVAGFEEYNAILTKFKEAKLEAIMTNNEALIGYRLKVMTDYLKLKMEGKPEETGPKLQETGPKFYETVTKLQKIGSEIKEKVDYLNQMKAKPEAKVKDKLKNINESIEEMTSNISKKLLSSNLNEAGLKAIEAGLDGIVAGLEEYNAILSKEKAAKERAAKTARRL
ncbi:hypothetical protein GINT2_000477 [Glugoides intestinalis]